MDTGATAWVLTSASLVLLMTPGLALIYGGMVRAKSVINMLMMSFGAAALVGVLWVLYGYSIAFGNDVGAGLLGNPTELLGLAGLMEDTTTEAGGLPAMAFVGFQAVFAILTVASLGFIGIGVKPPTPEWGSLLSVARNYMPDFYWMAAFPGLAIFVSVFGFNVLGDGLRDVFDPKARR